MIGPSGCGKSTLFHILAGLEDPDSGSVLIDDVVVERRLGACAFMPQRDGLLPWRRTIDNVTVGLTLAGVPRAEAHERARPLLERFGLGGFEDCMALAAVRRHAPPRRVPAHRPARAAGDAAGRALRGARRDHPLRPSALAVEIWEEVGSTVILITHDVAEAVYLADRVYVLSPRPGRVAATLDDRAPAAAHAGDARHRRVRGAGGEAAGRAAHILRAFRRPRSADLHGQRGIGRPFGQRSVIQASTGTPDQRQREQVHGRGYPAAAVGDHRV